jgi:hypothetical protein
VGSGRHVDPSAKDRWLVHCPQMGSIMLLFWPVPLALLGIIVAHALPRISELSRGRSSSSFSAARPPVVHPSAHKVALAMGIAITVYALCRAATWPRGRSPAGGAWCNPRLRGGYLMAQALAVQAPRELGFATAGFSPVRRIVFNLSMGRQR